MRNIVGYLPGLRRYARAMTGSQQQGDRYVEVCLQSLIEEPRRIATGTADPRTQLFQLFHDIWTRVDQTVRETGGGTAGGPIEQRLVALPPRQRQVLLLTVLERFSLAEVAEILRIEEDDAMALLAGARSDLARQAPVSILIIEDEAIIALSIAAIVEQSGHRVVGVADTRQQAIALARSGRPGLVLADIQLADGGSGIEAATEILRSLDVPVIFVTAFPERLLTGTRPEPTYLVAKPFEPETLQVAIAQALFGRPGTGLADQPRPHSPD